MLLFCGFVLQNPYYNLKTLSVGGLLMSGQVCFILGCGGTPEKGTPGSMPFFGNYPAILIAIQVQVLIE